MQHCCGRGRGREKEKKEREFKGSGTGRMAGFVGFLCTDNKRRAGEACLFG